MEAAEEELQFQDHVSRLPFARGGPIFVPGVVGQLMSVSAFKADVLNELQSLQSELVNTGECNFEDELSVDELKVLTEEELVENALKDDVKDVACLDDSQLYLECSDDIVVDRCISEKENVCLTNSISECINLDHSIISNDSDTLAHESNDLGKKVKKKKGTKRGRRFDRDSRATDLEGIFFTKVDELAKIKQRQDEDKLAARLHSFSGNSKLSEGIVSSSQKLKKMKSLRFITRPVKVKSVKSQEYVPVQFPEMVLCLEIYDNQYKWRKNQEFLALGSQTLSELKNHIYCLTNKLMDTAGVHDNSGYFLIEDTFCNDLKDPSSIDYSKPIFDWLKNNNDEAVKKWDYILSGGLKKEQKKLLGDMKVSSLPNFRSVDMHKTRFSDLGGFRLGSSYLYCHQGNCKHSIVIRDMRLIHPEDVQNRAEYPLLTSTLRPRYRKCSVCEIYIATKMTVDDKWAPKNPCYFCIKCYFLLHYKEDNSLLYPHTVFDYFHE
ncbi:snRNA-activating protein complex subunit-like isoform X1 [Zingiber officinale]|uniref:snRNA-activating protein complex subunit-like isoform X1 n=1 Tax=Zingiber officinale TaxID=94328 RepID=UPI001C4BFEC3|nr:snRNA-activating protein complex subunit-like isoform X1 [Zingiber officinale]